MIFLFVHAARQEWSCIKNGKISPGPLHSHAACRLPGSMLIFGGETSGNLSNDSWRFSFGKIIILTANNIYQFYQEFY